jgi:hypothetical protein
MSINGVFPAELVTMYVIAMLIAGVVVNLAFAGAVLLDPVRPVMVPRWMWALATLLGGPVVGALYWIVHRGVPAALPAAAARS